MADHGAAPAVGQRGPEGLEEDIHRVVVHAHVGAVQHLRDFPVNAPGAKAQLLPPLQAGRRQTFGELEKALFDAVFLHQGQGQFPGLGRRRQVCIDAEFVGHPGELLQVGYFVTRSLAFGHGEQRLHQVPAVVGVGGRARSHHAGEVAGHHDVRVRAAHPPLGAFPKRIDAAGPHDADAAGEPQVAKAAAGLLGGVPLPNGLYPLLAGLLLQGQGIGLDGERIFRVIWSIHRKFPRF